MTTLERLDEGFPLSPAEKENLALALLTDRLQTLTRLLRKPDYKFTDTQKAEYLRLKEMVYETFQEKPQARERYNDELMVSFGLIEGFSSQRLEEIASGDHPYAAPAAEYFLKEKQVSSVLPSASFNDPTLS
jgi:hypothetical protein